jgi:DNA-binding CsgD family transcriptional regulator
MLEPLGLDGVCEFVYVTVLGKPGMRRADLIQDVAHPGADISRAVDRLRDLTLLQARGTDELYAISPERGMEILLAVQQAELASVQQRLELSRVAAAQLISEHAGAGEGVQGGSPEVEYLYGIDSIRVRLDTLSNSVQSEVMNFSPSKVTSADVSAAKESTGKYAGTTVRSRSIYLHSALNHPPTVEYMEWLLGHGCELRTTPALPSRMVIFDRDVAVLPTNNDDHREGAVVLYGKATVTAFCSLFDWIWERSIPVDLQDAKRDEMGMALEVEAIWLLAQGYTDETVAKRLGVSPRTSRRIVESLMRRLGARSRFQAGVFAERHGMLSNSPL